MLQNLSSSKSNETSGELKPITFESLEKMKTSHGDLYWKKGDGKLVKLLHSGDYLDYSKLEKFQKVTETLYIEETCNTDFILTGKEYLKKLIEAENEKERLSCRHEFLAFIGDAYWYGKTEESLLSLIIIFKEIFYNISPEFELEMEEQAMSIFRRASMYSALVTTTALCAGYTHGEFLKDVYNISFFNDFSCARNLIKHTDSGHAKESCLEFEKSKFYTLKNKSLSRLITFHNEDFEGHGKELGLIYDELSELERLSIFIEKSLSSEEYSFSNNDGVMFLSKLFEVHDSDSFQIKRFKEEIKVIFLDLSVMEDEAS